METPPNVRDTEGAPGRSGESQLYLSSGFLKSLRDSFSQVRRGLSCRVFGLRYSMV